MLTVEECLKTLDAITWGTSTFPDGSAIKISNTWDARFINDVASHVAEGKAISTAQADIVIKLIGRYRSQLEAKGLSSTDLDVLVQHPTFLRPPYQSHQVARQVRWVGDNQLVFRCKYNAAIVEDIKKLRGVSYFNAHSKPRFNQEYKLWIVTINSGNLDRTMDVIKRHKFEFDSDVEMFFLNAANAFGQKSTADIENGVINIEVKDDDLLNAWIKSVTMLSTDDV